jgi:hypothetical protein
VVSTVTARMQAVSVAGAELEWVLPFSSIPAG